MTQGYKAPAAVVQTQIENKTPNQHSEPASKTSAAPQATVQPASSGSQLPFTGLDVGLVLAAGAALLAAGFGIRRITRPSSL